MPLTLTLRESPRIPIEVESIRLETVRAQSLPEILSTRINYGNQQPELGELFTAQGSACDDESVIWDGDCSKVKLIGTGLTRGRMTVLGHAGMHLGAEMRGGEIEVRGNAGDWLGAQLHGGRIRVRGNAGHHVGGVYLGGRKGMTGGEILIDGNAGDEVGRAMRRGLSAVGGQAGEAVGFNLIAGTILVQSARAGRHGAGMRRGTIGWLGAVPPTSWLPTFQPGAIYEPVFLRIFLNALEQQGFPLPEGCLTAKYQRISGDFLEQGRGEFLVRVAGA